jgi:hypothetical protein
MSALLQSLPKRRAAETDDGGRLRNLEGAIFSRSSMVGFAHESKASHLDPLTGKDDAAYNVDRARCSSVIEASSVRKPAWAVSVMLSMAAIG